MCGIIGVTGESDAIPLLLGALHQLEYRGYDSAGVAVVVEDLQTFLLENAWQPIESWPEPNQRILEEKGRVDGNGRV